MLRFMSVMNKVMGGMIGVLVLLGAGCAGADNYAKQQAAPDTMVKAFLQAVQDGDRAEAEAYAAPNSDLAEDFSDVWSELDSLTLKSFKVDGVKENAVTVTMEIEERGETGTDTATFKVKEEGGLWWLTDI